MIPAWPRRSRPRPASSARWPLPSVPRLEAPPVAPEPPSRAATTPQQAAELAGLDKLRAASDEIGPRKYVVVTIGDDGFEQLTHTTLMWRGEALAEVAEWRRRGSEAHLARLL